MRMPSRMVPGLMVEVARRTPSGGLQKGME